MYLFLFFSLVTLMNCSSLLASNTIFTKEGPKRTAEVARLEDSFQVSKKARLTPLSHTEVQEYASQALQGSKEAQQKLINYFQQRIGKIGTSLLAKWEKDIFHQLNLDAWESYYKDEYNAAFALLCISKASTLNIWIIPDRVRNQIFVKAQEGDVEAQFNLAFMYDRGIGFEEDKAEAMLWYWLAAKQGDVEAQFRLGLRCEYGLGPYSINETEAMPWYRLAAEKGHVEAQFHLGKMYADGRDVVQNDYEAVKWWQLAAMQKHAKAQFYLGIMYFKGRGVNQDKFEAVNLWQLAAEQGKRSAQYLLGRLYYNGQSVPKNFDLSLKFLLDARIKDSSQKFIKDNFITRPISIVKQNSLIRIVKFENIKYSLEDDENFLKDWNKLGQDIQEFHGNHTLEAMLNDPKGNANTSFKERGLAISYLHSHYLNLIQFEEKVMDVLEDLFQEGYLVNSWSLRENPLFKDERYRDEERYFESYDYEGKSYLCIGKEAVQKGNKLMAILKGEDKDLKQALSSVSFLRKVVEEHTLLGRAMNMQHVARQEKEIERQTFNEILAKIANQQDLLAEHQEGEAISLRKEELLLELEEIQKVPKYLATLLKQGIAHRNKLFEEEYPLFK